MELDAEDEEEDENMGGLGDEARRGYRREERVTSV